MPGGMVDAGEEVSETLKREFTEETLDGVESADIKHLWKKGKLVYKGYVDDPRNTDNAWMETVVMNFHDEDGVLEKVKFKVKYVHPFFGGLFQKAKVNFRLEMTLLTFASSR